MTDENPYTPRRQETRTKSPKNEHLWRRAALLGCIFLAVSIVMLGVAEPIDNLLRSPFGFIDVLGILLFLFLFTGSMLIVVGSFGLIAQAIGRHSRK